MIYRQQLLSLFCSIGSLFAFGHAQDSCRFRDCQDTTGKPTPCVPSSVTMSLTRNVSVTNTCGRPRARYCELPGPEPCGYCDANSTNPAERHPASNLVDFEMPLRYTWWQSQTWWDTNQAGLSGKGNPPKVNITLSFGKRYHLTGHIKVRFFSQRPTAMCIDKSSDFGHSWNTVQCYSRRCDLNYHMNAQSSPSSSNPFQFYCTEDYSSETPWKLGVVKFTTSNRYQVCDYFNPNVQDYLSVTDVRLRLEYPATDGAEVTHQTQQTLNKFYYAISNIEVTGRCSCNGHAQYCSGSIMQRQCTCQHNTMGTDCELCKPLFNNQPWMRANKMHANECQECECNNHGTSCVYNSTLNYGLCRGCQNNTEGDHCQNCTTKYYRDLSKPMNHVNACLACDCYPDGITNNGTCLSQSTETEQIGQCQCKPNVYGRRCDQCRPGHWGFTLPPRGECRACNCTVTGTRNASADCDQNTGQCSCKHSIQGQQCDECKDGYYNLPTVVGLHECFTCQCDLGGGYSVCNKTSGACYCRPGIHGHHCTQTLHGTFYPALDYILYEAETTANNFTAVTPATGSGSEFTERGYAQLVSGQPFVFHNIEAKVQHQYYLVLRYSTSNQCNNGVGTQLSVSAQGLQANWQIPLTNVKLGTGQALVLLLPEPLSSGQNYNFSVTYLGNNNCQFFLDSLVLVPDVNTTRVYQLSGVEVPGILQSCVSTRVAMSRINTEHQQCSRLVFSASTELYNGTLSCECNQQGAINPDQCMAYGGQCTCKPGVGGGRTCNHCLPGYYGFSSSGCTKCGCSIAGATTPVCSNTDGRCQCKSNAEGFNCDTCKYGTYNLDRDCPQGCQPCFGYGHAHNCTSAPGFVAKNITTNFVAEGTSGWTVVDRTGRPVQNSMSLQADGLLVTGETPSTQLFLSAPREYLGNILYSYKQRLHVDAEVVNVTVRARRSIQITTNMLTAILWSGDTSVTLFPDTTTGLITLDEMHINGSMTAFQFQSLLTNTTAIWVGLVDHPSPQSSVRFRAVSLGSAVANSSAAAGSMVNFVEKANCPQNYSGLSCQVCAEGYRREIIGSSPFGRCILCSCNNRSRQCHPDTGVCINCKVGTHGDHCDQCTNNVQGPECTSCKPQYWGLSRAGCKSCNCSLPGTTYSNTSTCDLNTGQCVCNTTVHIGGRLCDRCQENAYNTSNSLFSCRECSACYAYIHTDVHQVRADVARLQALSTAIHSLPVIQHDKAFSLRLNESILEARTLVSRSTRAASTKGDLDRRLAELGRDVRILYNLTEYGLSTRVNRTLMLSERAAADYISVNSSVHGTKMLVHTGYNTLNGNVKGKVEGMLRNTVDLTQQAAELLNTTRSADWLLNLTLNTNSSIQTKVVAIVTTATQATNSARAVNTTAVEFSMLLPWLHANVSSTRERVNRMLLLFEGRFNNVSVVLQVSHALAARASQPNPDNTQELIDMRSHTAKALSTSAAYKAQATALFNSSLPMTSQVITAIQGARDLEPVMRDIVRNATETRQMLQEGLSHATSALFNASIVHRDASRLLSLLKDFSGAAANAHARANMSLVLARQAELTGLQYIANVSAVNHSMHAAVVMGRRAVERGLVITQHARTELRVISKTQSQARDLQAATVSTEQLITNQTVRDFIRREIEPVQNVCLNLSTVASHVSEQANHTLQQAQQANSTADRLYTRAQSLHNQSTSLPRITEHRVPSLNAEIKRVRDQYTTLNVTDRVVALKAGIQAHKALSAGYRSRIDKLRAEIERARQMSRSLSETVSTCK